jgi:CHAD domain-containing protein
MSLDPDALHKPVRRLRKLLKNLPKRPPPEAVHDFRTSSRRFEAALAALKLEPKRTLDDVAQLRRRAGKVRDMDVLIHFASTLHPDGEDACGVMLLEHLGAQRQRYAKRLHATVTKVGRRTRKELKKAGKKLDGVDAGGEKVMAAATALAHELERVSRLDRKNLHPYRLKVKELRNTLRLAKDAGGELIDALAAVKDAIGEWHDWEQLAAIARDVLDHGAQCKLLRELEHTCKARYASALGEATQLQRKQLNAARDAAAHPT